MSRGWLFLSITLIFLLSAVGSASAQSAEGVISGVVVDRYGKPLKRAAVRASNLDDGLTVESLTDDKGGFRMDQMTPGSYEVQASLGKLGVQTKKAKLPAGKSIRVDFMFDIREPRAVDPTYRPSPPSLI